MWVTSLLINPDISAPGAAPLVNEKWNLVHLRATGSQLCVFLETGYIYTLGPPEGCLGWGEHFVFCGSRISSECYGLTVMGWMFAGDESL